MDNSDDIQLLSQTDLDELNGWYNYCENLCYEDMCSKQFDEVGCYILDNNFVEQLTKDKYSIIY